MIILSDINNNKTNEIVNLLNIRKSVRLYNNKKISFKEISLILWAAGGITIRYNYKLDIFLTYPSAGGLYPLNFYVIINNVENIDKGIYIYNNIYHSLNKLNINNELDLYSISHNQDCFKNVSAIIIVTINFNKTISKYGEINGYKYALLDCGHSGQNIYLMATALGLGTVAIGAFDNEILSNKLKLNKDRIPIYLFPIGKEKVK